jgi:hypothetical protein
VTSLQKMKNWRPQSRKSPQIKSRNPSFRAGVALEAENSKSSLVRCRARKRRILLSANFNPAPIWFEDWFEFCYIVESWRLHSKSMSQKLKHTKIVCLKQDNPSLKSFNSRINIKDIRIILWHLSTGYPTKAMSSQLTTKEDYLAFYL